MPQTTVTFYGKRGEGKGKKYQYESLGKRYQYPVPPEVHRGYVHPFNKESLIIHYLVNVL